MRTIHISGASGYLGGKLCEFYLRKGYSVNALIRKESRNKLSNHPKLFITEVDFDNLEDLNFEISTNDVLIHTASTNVPNTELSYRSLVQVNVEYGLKLMREVSLAKGRFLNIGTNWQHFKNNSYSPVSLYAASKQAHLAFQTYFEEVEGLHAKNLELCDTYGPDDPRDKLIPLLLGADDDKSPIELTSGTQLIDLVHIDDVVRSIDMIIKGWNEPEIKSSLSLTSGSLLSIKDLVSLCDDVRGKSIPVIWGVKQPQYKRQMRENWAFHEVPHNWKPKVDLKEGLQEVLSSIRSMKAGT